MGTIYIPENDDYYNAVGDESREISRISNAAPKHPGTVYVYVLGQQANSPFSVGKRVYVKSPNYDFTAIIWHIYQGSAGYNLYVKTAFIVDDYSGSVSTSQIVEVTTEDNLHYGDPDEKIPDITTKTKETVASVTGGSKNLIWIGLAAVVGYFLFFRKKGKKGKK